MLPTPPHRCFIIVDNSTIRERRDKQQERPPTKRQRVESDDEDYRKDGLAQTASTSQNRWVPQACPAATTGSIETEFVELDPTYYTESPDSIIVRVQNTLFKFHKDVLNCSDILRSRLEEHGSTTELSPLCLKTPTVEEFRALLWANLVNVEELEKIPSSDEHLDRLFNIAAMTMKFDAPKVAVWVSETILKVAECSSILDACSSATLSRFVDITVSHKYYSALALVVHKWCERLLGNGAPSVPAIQTADKYEDLKHDNMRKLRGIAYYVHIQDMLDRQTAHTQSDATHLRTDPKLNNGQVMRLLAGYWSLVTLWERMRVNPIRLPQAPGCSEEKHDKCCATWSRRWISAVGWKRILDHSSADILALLGTLRDQLSNDDDLRSGMHMECRSGGLHEIRKVMDSTRAGLADHFVGCL